VRLTRTTLSPHFFVGFLKTIIDCPLTSQTESAATVDNILSITSDAAKRVKVVAQPLMIKIGEHLLDLFQLLLFQKPRREESDSPCVNSAARPHEQPFDVPVPNFLDGTLQMCVAIVVC